MKTAHWSHSRTYLPLIALSLLLTACASSQKLAPSSPLAIPTDIAGIVHAGHTNTPEEYALVNRLGAQWTLTTFSWREIEPSQGQWDFDSYDQYVEAAQTAGIKIIGVLAYDVAWIHPDNERHRYIPPDKIPFFLEYVRQTASRFRGKVDAWCIWNEPNTTHFWKGSRDDFLNLARQAADTLRETDPDVIILSGAFNRGISGLPKAYIRGLFETGAMENANAIAFHPYELNPARTARLYNEFRAMVAEYGFADKIWITEAGYPTGGWYPTATSEKKFPAYIVKTFVNLSIGGAQKILWYQLFDPLSRVSRNSEHFFGLVRSREDYTSKGAEAFRLCAVHLAGTIYRPDLPPREKLPRSLRTFYFERPTGGGTLVLWKEGVTARVTLQTPTGSALHDPVSGSSTPMPAETTITVGSMPVFVTWTDNGAVRVK
ncbi:MAG: cellulase family glycosylhydrolase [Treponema sp.]|nr:cellulase family glycosylhydrolase [Treponema sp.]